MVASRDTATAAPEAVQPFELRIEKLRDNEVALEVWQQPLNGTPAGSRQPVKVARIRGTALHAAWDHLISLLRRAGMRPALLSPSRRERATALAEEVGVRVALLAATLAPLRKLERIERIAAGLDAMSYEEACYWYAHIRSDDHGGRALRALRLLLAPD